MKAKFFAFDIQEKSKSFKTVLVPVKKCETISEKEWAKKCLQQIALDILFKFFQIFTFHRYWKIVPKQYRMWEGGGGTAQSEIWCEH